MKYFIVVTEREQKYSLNARFLKLTKKMEFLEGGRSEVK
jgi:hypothetical protein